MLTSPLLRVCPVLDPPSHADNYQPPLQGYAHAPYEWAPNSVDIQMLRVGNFGVSDQSCPLSVSVRPCTHSMSPRGAVLSLLHRFLKEPNANLDPFAILQ